MLAKLVESLPPEDRRLFRRIFRLEVAVGRLKLPKPLEGWVKERFGSLGRVQRQRIVKVVNKVTFEGAFFNELRSLRPVEAGKPVSKEVFMEREDCAFCRPLEMTPEDVFGRVKGPYCVSASNIAKYDRWHGIIVFSEHNPLRLGEKRLEAWLNQAFQWFKRVAKADGRAVYPFLLWNCLWRSGASMVHGHMQMVAGRTPYPKVEALWRQAKRYEARYKSNYFEDLYQVHRSLGLGFQHKAFRVLAYLTPVKEREVFIYSWKPKGLARVLNKVLQVYGKLGVESFNFSLALPPLRRVKGWEEFPYLARLVDRGKLEEKTSDIGGMELYAASIVSSDPFQLAEKLKAAFKG